LAGEDCFSLSNFFLHDDIDVVRPSYHFFAPYHAPLVLENYIDWLREADRRLPLNTAIVLGHSGLPLVEKYLLFPERTIYYLYLSESVSMKRVDLLKPVMTPQTGTIMILPVLIYMGYSEIYLLGCDHNVLRNYGGRVENFYQASQEIRENATNEKSWVGIVDTHASSMRVFQQYGFYKRIFDQKGILVKNLSRGSWLDSFPFDDLENIVKSDFA
jgi:hypothetical protein